MKKILLELLYCIFLLSQFFTAYIFLAKIISDFSFDNICILIAASSGLYFTLDFGREFIEKWSN